MRTCIFFLNFLNRYLKSSCKVSLSSGFFIAPFLRIAAHIRFYNCVFSYLAFLETRKEKKTFFFPSKEECPTRECNFHSREAAVMPKDTSLCRYTECQCREDLLAVVQVVVAAVVILVQHFLDSGIA
jgi:hypothetical protein